MRTTIPGYLTTLQSAALLGVTRCRMHQLRKSLGAIHVGNILLFPENSVKARKRRMEKLKKPCGVKAAREIVKERFYET